MAKEDAAATERTALLDGGKAEREKEEKLADVELGPNGLWETAKERRQRKYGSCGRLATDIGCGCPSPLGCVIRALAPSRPPARCVRRG